MLPDNGPPKYPLLVCDAVRPDGLRQRTCRKRRRGSGELARVRRVSGRIGSTRMPLRTDQLAMAHRSVCIAACGLASALLGCGPPVQGPSPRPRPVAGGPSAPAVGSAATQPPAAPLFPEGPLAALPPGLAEVAEVACSFRQKGTFHVTEGADGGYQPLKLRFDSATAPFAEALSYDEAVVDLPIGPRSHARASIEVLGAIRVSGILDLDAIAFHATHPFVIGGLFVPQEYTPLRWESGAPGVATVSIAMTHVHAAPELYRAAQPCADVAAGWQWFPPPAEQRPWLGSAVLRAGTTGIASAPGKPVSASVLVAEGDDRLVDVTEVRGKQSRITLHADSALIVGWVAGSALTASSTQAARDYLPPSAMFGIGQHGSPIRVACSTSLPLVAEVLFERRTVGEIRAGTTLGIDERHADFCVANLMGPAAVLAPAPGARFLVRTGDLAGCKVLPEPSPAAASPR
jgi:hypothetical protein